MQWQSVVPVHPGSPKITYRSELFSMGSCFAGHLGNKLEYYKFRQVCNPFGVIFHPVPLVRLIQRALNDQPFVQGDLMERNGLWYCLETHSCIYNTSSEALLRELNERLKQVKRQIARCSHMVITLGTAWGYRHLGQEMIVANCHKLPAHYFHKELSKIPTLEMVLRQLVKTLRMVNSDIVLIFTVSPVRHLKDGFEQNGRSKAHLLAAVHQIVENNESARYFPSYEIVMDQLRDYRFYASDMVHPSPQAIDYIWERFSEAWLNPSTTALQNKVASVQRRMAHQALRPDSAEYREFRSLLEADIQSLKNEIPWARFSE